MIKVEQLQKTSFLKYFSCQEIEQALKSQEFLIKRFKKGEILHMESDPCLSVDIVLQGSIDSIRLDEQGNTFRVATFKCYESIGGALIFSSNPIYPMNLTACCDVVMLKISKGFLERALSNKEFLMYYITSISDLTLELSNKIKNHVHKSIRQNLLLYFQKECNRNNSNQLVLRITKKQLAENLGIQRTSLSRELRKMVNDKIITINDKTITLL